MPTTQRRKLPGLWSCVFTTAIAGLAAGALWCLLALGLSRGGEFLIVPLGGAIGWYLRWLGYRSRRGVVCAVASVLVAFVYAQWLFAAVRVAQMLGFSLRATLFKMDWGLAWQAASANLGTWDFVWLALACVAAMWITRRSKTHAA
ncbi:MAG: hypothetical protein JSS28_02470 [Proteobacteria bacterium]|nr:hypothetical protein [Pseudomonadota bacterium]